MAVVVGLNKPGNIDDCKFTIRVRYASFLFDQFSQGQPMANPTLSVPLAPISAHVPNPVDNSLAVPEGSEGSDAPSLLVGS
jgi:hypothetical protein